MKSFLRSATALAGIMLAGSAFAADLPRRMAPPPVFTPVPVFTWTGFYAGFNAGYGFGVQDDNGPTYIAASRTAGLFLNNAGQPTTGAIAFAGNNSSSGFTGGGQVGYNYQFTPGTGIVVGVEADAQYVDFGRRRGAFAVDVPGGGGVNPGVTFVNPNGLSSLDFFGTVRGRIGVAFDRALFYGTGGFAYASGGNDLNVSGVSSDDFRTGYTAGLGVEYALPTDSFLNFFRSSAVTFKVEALYVNLDHNNGTNGYFGYVNNVPVANVLDPKVVTTGYLNNRNDEFVVVRGGVNYKFGSY